MIDEENGTYFDLIFSQENSKKNGAKEAKDEEELGSTEPEAFKLKVEEYMNSADYVKSFVAEVRKLHRSDVKNEIRRKESLGYNFKTENLQPSAFRKPLVGKNNQPVRKYYLTAFVPILRESYRAEFNGCKRPKYFKLKTEESWMRDIHVMGVLTAAPMAQVPPVTICEQLNDLRVDDHFNHVYTYVF